MENTPECIPLSQSVLQSPKVYVSTGCTRIAQDPPWASVSNLRPLRSSGGFASPQICSSPSFHEKVKVAQNLGQFVCSRRKSFQGFKPFYHGTAIHFACTHCTTYSPKVYVLTGCTVPTMGTVFPMKPLRPLSGVFDVAVFLDFAQSQDKSLFKQCENETSYLFCRVIIHTARRDS